MKKRITSYTFDASAKTIAFGAGLEIEGFLLIVNVVDNIIIYNFADATVGGTYAADTLTLAYNTSSMSDTDELLIYYDDGLTTQAVSGTITAELSAADNAVLDEIKIDTEAIRTAVEAIQAAQLPDGHNVTVDNASLTVDTGLTQPLTDTELRATAVPVSLDISSLATAANQQTDALTDTELRATPVPVSGSVTVDLGANNDVTVTSGAITETNSGAIKTAVETIDNAISGTEMQVDVVTMPTTTVQATNLDIRDLSQATDGVAIYGSDDGGTTKRLIKTDAGGAIQVDLEVAGVTVDNVTIDNEGGVAAVNVQDGGNSLTVDGTITAELSATDNAVLDAIELNTDSGAVVGVGAAATAQRVHLADESLSALENITVTSSGTVTANAGTNLNTSALALESGGNLAAIKAKTDNIPALGQALAAASVPVILPAATITTLTPPAAITGFATSAKQDTIIGHIDGIEALLTTIEGNQLADGHNVTVDNASIAVTGTFWQATQPVSGTVTANTGLTQPLTDTQLRATPVPVSGTVTSNLSATDNAVLDAIQAATEAIETAVEGTLTVTGGGGGVEYTEGDTDATITGSVAMMEVGSDTLQPIQGTVAGGLLVNLGSNNDVTVTGSVTADLGANNDVTVTSGAITETNSGAIKTAVEVIDNAISGSEMQVDVVAALPAGTAIIGKVGHDVTGIGHGVKTVTTAGTDVALAASTACKKVDIQAQTDNTSVIAVGGSGVDATVATGTGVLLYPGDVYSLEIDNLNDVYIDSLVNGEGVRFTYYT